MADKKISALTPNTSPTWSEEFVYAYNNSNGKITLDTMKTFASADSQPTLVSWTNIKTINNQDILWSWNLTIWWAATELTADANIWELEEWIYVTEHDLYYTTWNKVRFYIAWGGSWRQMLFVVNQSWRWNAFFVYNVWHNSQYTQPRCSYWYSKSSSEWETHLLREWDASLQEYAIITWATDFDAIWSWWWMWFTQLIDWAEDNQSLSVSWTVYSWATYTMIVNSVAAWQTYSVTLWTWVTNPLNITLPNLSNKKCVITLVATSASTAIVTWCTMWS